MSTSYCKRANNVLLLGQANWGEGSVYIVIKIGSLLIQNKNYFRIYSNDFFLW